jgi:hypothetical protein
LSQSAPNVTGRKTRRNDPCPCGSGQKYKYCCISLEKKRRLVDVDKALHPSGTLDQADFTDDLMNIFSSVTTPLKNFCKDNKFYLFGSILTIGKLEEFNQSLKRGLLTKSDLISYFASATKREHVEAWIEDACADYQAFTPRKTILLDAVEAHFSGKYTLSVPVLFAQLEGILRDIGELKISEHMRPTIKRDIWNNRLLFSMSDDAVTFNAFIHKLYEGQKDSTEFNRNPVLHGTNLAYDSEEYSLLLILTLLEIRTFLWFEKNTQPIV